MRRELKPLPKRPTTPASLVDALRKVLPGYAPELTDAERNQLNIPMPPDNDREP